MEISEFSVVEHKPQKRKGHHQSQVHPENIDTTLPWVPATTLTPLVSKACLLSGAPSTQDSHPGLCSPAKFPAKLKPIISLLSTNTMAAKCCQRRKITLNELIPCPLNSCLRQNSNVGEGGERGSPEKIVLYFFSPLTSFHPHFSP